MRLGVPFHDVAFQRPGGKRLHGWLVEADDARYTMLYCHGNAGNISHRLDAIRQYRDMGISVFIFDYAGYGQSEGRPSESGTYADARAAWAYLTTERSLSPRDIIIYGRSLGAAVAIKLATEVTPRALIVEAAFTSAVQLGERAYPWLPVRFLARARYDSASRIQDVRCPVLFVHSLQDEVVPFGMGRRLFNRAGKPKTFVKTRGSHNDSYLLVDDKSRRALEAFLDSLDDRKRSL